MKNFKQLVILIYLWPKLWILISFLYIVISLKSNTINKFYDLLFEFSYCFSNSIRALKFVKPQHHFHQIQFVCDFFNFIKEYFLQLVSPMWYFALFLISWLGIIHCWFFFVILILFCFTYLCAIILDLND